MQRELSEIEGPIAMPGNKFAISTADLMSLRMDAMADSDSSNDRKEMGHGFTQRSGPSSEVE